MDVLPKILREVFDAWHAPLFRHRSFERAHGDRGEPIGRIAYCMMHTTGFALGPAPPAALKAIAIAKDVGGAPPKVAAIPDCVEEKSRCSAALKVP
jgi:hypothetical protein